jgi:hypothetical protein
MIYSLSVCMIRNRITNPFDSGKMSNFDRRRNVRSIHASYVIYYPRK